MEPVCNGQGVVAMNDFQHLICKLVIFYFLQKKSAKPAYRVAKFAGCLHIYIANKFEKMHDNDTCLQELC